MSDDPCELDPSEIEKEEEVDPEFESSDELVFTADTADLLEEVEGLTDNEAQEAEAEAQQAAAAARLRAAGSTTDLESVQELAQGSQQVERALSRRDLTAMETEKFLPGTELALDTDVSVIGAFSTMLRRASAQKSTWLFNNSAVLGATPSVDDVRVSGDKTFFYSKPKKINFDQIGGRVASNTHPRPVSVPNFIATNYYDPNSPETGWADPVRWIADKTWMNAGHLDGAYEYDGDIVTLKTAHGRFASSNLYFINKQGDGPNWNSENSWGVFYKDSRKQAYFEHLEDYERYGFQRSDLHLPQTWRYYDNFKQKFDSMNAAGHKIKYELHRIACFKEEDDEFNWGDYFYGHLKEFQYATLAEGSVSDNATGTQKRVTVRTSANESNFGPLNWRNIFDSYSDFNNLNMNMNPVIPFWGTIPVDRAQFSSGDFKNQPPSVGNHYFEDYCTNVLDLLTKEEIESQREVQRGSTSNIDIRPVYSYFDSLHENYFANPDYGLHESELPSPYLRDIKLVIQNLRKEGLSTFATEDYEELLAARLSRAATAKAEVDWDGNAAALTDTALQAQTFGYIQSLERNSDSIREFAKLMDDYYGFNIIDGAAVTPEDYKRNFYLSSLTREQLDDAYEMRYINPMFVEIEMGSVEKSQIAEALTFNGDKTVIQGLIAAFEDSQPTSSAFSYVQQNIDALSFEGISTTISAIDYSDTVPLTEYKMLDFSEWISERMDEFSSAELPPVEKFATIFRMLMLRMRINRVVNSSARTYKQIMSGVPAKSEVIGFAIEKYEVTDNNRLNHLSNFYIMSNNDRDVEKFVDTQIKYGKVYEYKINRIVAVVGNKYAYLNPMRFGHRRAAYAAGPRVENGLVEEEMVFGVGNLPCLKLVYIPSDSKRVTVIDKPPVYPNVDIIPFKNVSDKILFNLSANSGEFSAPPILLESDDTAQFFAAALNQGLQDVFPTLEASALRSALESNFVKTLTSPRAMIKFRSDDPATTFEIFRIEKYPKSYKDFENRMIKKITGLADNAAFVDHVMPNTKYYYVFRTEDIHSHVSNPTHIYEVELSKINDAVKLNMRIVQPTDVEQVEKDLKESTKTLRHFISFRPNLAQRRVRIPSTGMFKEIRISIR